MGKVTGKRAVTQQAKESRKDDLMKAALDLFAEGGFNTAKIGDITDAAGLSTGTFYLYFDSKTEIYRTLYHEGMEILEKYFNEVFQEKENLDFFSLLRKLVYAYFEFYSKYNRYYKILYISYLGAEKYFGRDDVVEILDKKALYMISLLSDALKYGIEEKILRQDMDHWTTAVAFWGFIDGLLFLNEKGNIPLVEVSLDKIIDQALDIVLKGIDV